MGKAIVLLLAVLVATAVAVADPGADAALALAEAERLARERLAQTESRSKGVTMSNGLFLSILAGSVALVPRPWASPVAAPKGSQPYQGTLWTQSISVLDGRDRIAWARVTDLEAKWHGSGGLVGLKGWKSDKYRYVPAPGVKSWVGDVRVLNSLGFYQLNRGILRSYPDGTRFDDVLTNTETGKVFEHRTRTKLDGKWRSTVPYADVSQRPKGYEGLKQSCASCHNQAGSGGYAVGLVPGGDGVLSDPLDWSLVTGRR